MGRRCVLPQGSVYSLWRGASQVERCENQFNTLSLPCHKRIDALTGVASRIDERRRSKRSVLRTARTTHKCTVTLCENKRHETSETWQRLSQARVPLTNITLFEIWGYHGGDVNVGVLGCNAMWTYKQIPPYRISHFQKTNMNITLYVRYHNIFVVSLITLSVDQTM